MGQKINPISLRLQSTNRNFDNCWYSNYFYKNLINKDIILQHYFNNFLKLLKFPTGRYSVQHLQKKTQVYNFLCNSKPTREWRSKGFGLTPKTWKKNKFFFKHKTQFKKTRKKSTKWTFFYNTLNQLALHKIQKRITSFQNYQLWSGLQKTSFHKNLSLSIMAPSSDKLTNLSNYLSPKFNMWTPSVFEKKFGAPLLIKKRNKLLTKKISNQQNFSSLLILNQQQKGRENLKENESFFEIKDNSNLLFLQNLFVAKTLKQTVPQKKKNERVNVFPSFSRNQFPQKVARNLLDFKAKNYLEFSLSSLYNVELDLIPFKVKNDWQHANFLANEIVYFLEKRIPFRKLKNKILKQLSRISTIRGVRITCSGRVGGKSKKAQRAKTECLKYGQTSLQVFSSKIDFSMKTAFTRFGSVGVKVWICYE